MASERPGRKIIAPRGFICGESAKPTGGALSNQFEPFITSAYIVNSAGVGMRWDVSRPTHFWPEICNPSQGGWADKQRHCLFPLDRDSDLQTGQVYFWRHHSDAFPGTGGLSDHIRDINHYVLLADNGEKLGKLGNRVLPVRFWYNKTERGREELVWDFKWLKCVEWYKVERDKDYKPE